MGTKKGGDAVYTCEFRLADGDSVIGTKQMETLPKVEDEVTIEGRTYVVEDCPSNPSSSDAVVICVRRPFSI